MIIAISAPAYKSGKDTVADLIEKHSKQYWKRRKFADKLKDFVCSLIGCTREDLEEQSFKESTLGPEWDFTVEELKWDEGVLTNMPVRKPQTVRGLLIAIGDGLRGLVSPRIWVNGAKAGYVKGDRWIFTDWRYAEGEAEWLESVDAITLRVVRPGIQLIDHPSERSLDNYNFSYTIINDGTLEELEEKVIKFVKHYNL